MAIQLTLAITIEFRLQNSIVMSEISRQELRFVRRQGFAYVKSLLLYRYILQRYIEGYL